MSDKRDITTRQESMPERSSEIPTIAPLVDIYENDDEILLHADMPGVKKDDITINIDNGKLEITGMRSLQSSGATGWEEFGEVEYQRIFSVPQSIDVDKVNADLTDGVLKLSLPKAEAAKPRRIEIRS
ncbi:Hsp20/alpha crystallin family protein [Desulfopila sp. IMCC35008]|uniref:Hsp20/alpha crystallin family protein n=1 Tax=Desulfopila sp. IMCC35008 TaxID=2653858 RepID=UPI0013D46AE3|nr:Hsp20/alpha crystallin family protein [Desulfopila sp. IMCC35008]